MSRKTAILEGLQSELEGLQERGRRDGDCSVLRDALQRSVDDELFERKIERVSRFPSSHSSRPDLQIDQTLRRTSGENGQSF